MGDESRLHGIDDDVRRLVDDILRGRSDTHAVGFVTTPHTFFTPAIAVGASRHEAEEFTVETLNLITKDVGEQQMKVVGEDAGRVVLDSEARLQISQDEIVVEYEEAVGPHGVLTLGSPAREHLNGHWGRDPTLGGHRKFFLFWRKERSSKGNSKPVNSS